jgi:hypothetical protein
MLKLLGAIFLMTQLTGGSTGLPAVLKFNPKPLAVKAGQPSEVAVTFELMNGYAINRTPQMQLKLTDAPGVTLEQTEFKSNPDDPKSKDEYYVDLPAIKVPLRIAKAGRYEIPARLVYFFCSKADGFCARNILDFRIPVNVN